MKQLLKKDYFLPIIFAFMILAAYPLSWARTLSYSSIITNWSLLEGFSWEIIGYFAFGLIAFKYRELWNCLKQAPVVAIGCAVYILILILQQIFIFCSPYYLAGGMSYLGFIGVGYLYAKEFKKLLQPIMWLFLLFSILCNIHDFTMNAIPGGFTGNWNWSASLTVISALSILFIFAGKLPGFRYKWGIYFSVILLLASIYVYFACHAPKGTYLGIIVGCGALLWGYLDYFTTRKVRLFSLLAIFAVLSVSVILLKSHIADFMRHDTRQYLFENGIKVIENNALLGCEYGRYLSESADKMPPEYFLTNHASSLHNHPHNEILFLLANFGIGGLTIIAFMFYVFIRGLFMFEKKRDYERGYFLFVYCVLFAHSMVDVLLMHWPNGAIFYLLCGALLPMFNEEKTAENRIEKIPGLKIFLCLLFFIPGVYFGYKNFMSSYYMRQAVNLGSKEAQRSERFELTALSLYYRPTCKNVNDAAILSSNIKDSISIMENMSALTGIEHYAHKHFYLADMYMQYGIAEKAIYHYQKEYECFPLSVRNLYFYQLALDKIGEKERSREMRKYILQILQIKGLEIKHLSLLINNQDYDLNSGLIPKKYLQQQPQHKQSQ